MLGQDTFWVDEDGAKEAFGIIGESLSALVEVREEAKARLAAAGEEGFPISYLLAGYEGSLRPV
jgi:hypothetical protein